MFVEDHANISCICEKKKQIEKQKFRLIIISENRFIKVTINQYCKFMSPCADLEKLNVAVSMLKNNNNILLYAIKKYSQR